jgi:hypothetical protein
VTISAQATSGWATRATWEQELSPPPQRLSRRSRSVAAASVISAAIVHLVAQAGMVFTTPNWAINTVRSYYNYDQMSYLAIVVNWSLGFKDAVEPFSRTGSIYYPRLYYEFLGTISRVTGAQPAAVWTVVGLVVQAVLVVAIGTSAVLLTRKAWAGFVGFVPFVVGVLANFTHGGMTWSHEGASHSRIWGIYASLFTLNGDAAALAVAAISLLTLILFVSRRIRGQGAIFGALAACLAIGCLSAMQTYTFLAASYLLAYIAAAYGMTLVRLAHWRRTWIGLSCVLVASIYLLGPVLSDKLGPLALLVFGMTPAVPGLILLWRAHGKWVLFGACCYVVGALPQTVATLAGLAGGDPFLLYRQESSSQLGVPLWDGIVGALPVALPLLLVALIGFRLREPLWCALPLAGLTAWFVLASNDVWKANQEPYRLWISSFGMLAAVGVPVTLWAGMRYLEAARGWQRPAAERSYVLAFALLALAVLVLSLPDWVRWRQEVTRAGFIKVDTPELIAAAEAAQPAMDGSHRLVLTGPCIDPKAFKAVYGGSVAFYNYGLAWAEKRDVLALYWLSSAGQFNPAAAAELGVGWLITDSECETPIDPVLDPARLVRSVPYHDGDRSGVMQLWRSG